MAQQQERNFVEFEVERDRGEWARFLFCAKDIIFKLILKGRKLATNATLPSAVEEIKKCEEEMTN